MNEKAQYNRVKKAVAELQSKGVKIADLPPLSDFNVESLRSAYMSYKAKKLSPELVFVPGLSIGEWETILQGFKQTENGIWKSNEHDNVELTNPDAEWQVAVIPGANKPPITNLSWDGTEGAGKIEGSIKDNSPTLDLYLALQWTKLLQGKDPVDGDWYWSFVNILNYTGLRAPAAYWNPADGRVFVAHDVVGFSDGSLGLRRPVWGSTLVSTPSLESSPFDLITELAKLTDKAYAQGKNDTVQQIKDFLETL